MWVVAHRGGAELFPENTITAFTQLAKLGVNLVECDVHLSADGHLVAIHDDNLLRTAGLDSKIASMTREELRRVNVGDEFGVPALIDILEAIHLPVAVELKSPATVQALEKLLHANPSYVSRIVPLSFFHDILRYLNERFPSLFCGALMAGFVVDPVHVAKSSNCRMLSLHFEGLQPSFVERCHAGDVLVSVWTPNTREAICGALATGVDAIGSDRPDLVLQILAEDKP